MKKDNIYKEPFGLRLKKDLKKNYGAYLLFLPVALYYLMFAYKPMYGILVAFKDYVPMKGIWGSPWTSHHGLGHFLSFFQSFYFGRVLKNTLIISLTTLLVTFPAPIILALLLNEVRNRKFKKCIQTVSYMPHFISLVVICSMIRLFVADHGLITGFLKSLGLVDGTYSLLSMENYFVPIYVISGLWQTIGWSAIIYISALAGIDQGLYEAARMDGANKFKQMLHVTIPGLMPTIIMLFILRIGQVMSIGHEKIILLYNEEIYATADVISSFVYRKGLLEYNWGFSTAVGLFNSVINFALVIIANKISRKTIDMGLW
ncbi:sugar ABC transporter permease [Clostridium sp. chh4-2]|uniref:ABC transporter permease n=1 Tax=Clostridium sp. chh4-2 TaxID=2067550 RepID=UPI000CCF4086|nr:ABC transporter permease subunit [Clostridium sp. chh4-2]PNV60799.1 sugar ABC transporter permease [Clostridium sp. chh4-2]